MKRTLTYIKTRFEDFDFPTGQDFVDLIDSLDIWSDVMTAMALKTDSTDFIAALGLKVNTTDFTTALALKLDITDMNFMLSGLYTKVQTDTAIATAIGAEEARLSTLFISVDGVIDCGVY